MFFYQVLYPNFDKNMTLAKQESLHLLKYLQEVYDLRDVEMGSNGLLKFPLTSRWLRGEEYAFMLRHYKSYSRLEDYKVNFQEQDQMVYENPKGKIHGLSYIVGMIFYIKGQHLRNFGFPRLKEDNMTPVYGKGKLKRFLWKKTNFVTDLPKHSPIARYLVAHTSSK